MKEKEERKEKVEWDRWFYSSFFILLSLSLSLRFLSLLSLLPPNSPFRSCHPKTRKTRAAARASSDGRGECIFFSSFISLKVTRTFKQKGERVTGRARAKVIKGREGNKNKSSPVFHVPSRVRKREREREREE